MRDIIKKTILGIVLYFTGSLSVNAQQNIQFTQYIFNSLSVNPAYAGYKEEWFGQITLRNQWAGLDGAPKTGQLFIDGVINPEKKNVGVGLQITNDRLGAQSSTSIYANYAYRLRINSDENTRLSVGIGVGVTQYGLDGSKLNAVDPGDEIVSVNNIHNLIPDARFGIYFSNSKWYAGASIMNLLSDDISNKIVNRKDQNGENIMRKRHLYLIVGNIMSLSESIALRPSLLLKEDFKGPTSLDINAMLIFGEKFWVGGSYRSGVTLWNKSYKEGQNDLSSLNSFSAITNFQISQRLKLGYSYDYIISKLSSVQNGTHELTLGIVFPSKSKRIVSPRFF